MSPIDPVLRFGVFELDVRTGELRRRGRKLRLQGQPLQVLATLLKRAGDLVTREQLRSEIWPADTFVDFDHSLHNAVARIRETLGDSTDTPRYIETLPRRGYRFIERVEEIKPEGSFTPARYGRGGETPAIQSLAVLPLQDHSEDPGQEYFADGMTEALITSLAKIKALRVISRTSVMRYRRTRKSLSQIARELNVDALVEGSVMRSGHRMRITAQLIRAATDQHLWAESYERDFRDILSLQSEIARHVADEVRIILTPEERARLRSTRQVDPQAHEFYLKARHYWNKRSEESVRKAISYFHRAIDTDPTYAHGYAGLADCFNILGYYNALPPTEAYPKAKAAALKALELDESLAEPHAALGVIMRDFEWDWSQAEKEFQHAIELNPGYVEAYHWGSTMLSMRGRHDEAVREKRRALAMDPLSVVIQTDLARMYYFSRDYDQALSEYRAAIDTDPNFGPAHLGLAHVYEQKGMFEDALSELRIGAQLSDNSIPALAQLGHGYALGGKFDQARSVLAELHEISNGKYVSACDLAMLYVALQENDAAFAWLQRALEQRCVWLGYLAVEPQLDALRSTPRFEHFLRCVGLDGHQNRPSVDAPTG